MFSFGLLNSKEQQCMEKCEKCSIEIELELQCVYSRESHAASNKGICIGLLRTVFFFIQNNTINSKMHCKYAKTMQ